MASTINGTSTGNGGLVTTGDDSGILQLQTNETTAVTIDASQNVGIGTSSPQSTFQVGSINAGTSESTNKGLVQIQSAPSSIDSAGGLEFKTSSSGSGYGWKIGGLNAAGDPFVIGNRANSATFTERMRIDSSGNLLVGTTSFGGGSTIGFQINATNNTSGAYAQLIKNSSGTEIFQMRCNGGLANFSANNANLSDERTKTEIQDAGSYLSKICAIPVRTFKYKDQTDDLLNLGCIAQEVEAVAPELVDVTGFGETPEDGVPLKAIYQTDLQYALMKCIQEQQSLITTLTERITVLEGATQ